MPKTEISRFLGIKLSSMYNIKRSINSENKKIFRINKIIKIFQESRNTYGANRIKNVLCEEGEKISTNTVSLYMKELNLIPMQQMKIQKNKRIKQMKPNFEKLTNKIRFVKPDHLNQIWTTDITEIKTNQNKCYLATIMDRFSRKIISYDVSYKMDTSLVVGVLKRAVTIRNPKSGIFIHSDKGMQYRSNEWINYVKSFGGILSYTRPNYNCADNAVQESFHATLKKEELYVRPIQSVDEAKIRIADYIENFYNKRRCHSFLKTSPDNFELQHKNSIDYTNDINYCSINRIDLLSNTPQNEKEKMYMILKSIGYVYNEKYQDLNEIMRSV